MMKHHAVINILMITFFSGSTFAGAGSGNNVTQSALPPHANPQNKSPKNNSLLQALGLKVQNESGTGVLPLLAMRSLYDARKSWTPFMQDGIPIALAPYSQDGISLYPVSLSGIDHVDILRGGTATAYGPNNVRGVINIVSKPLPDKWENEVAERDSYYGHGRHQWDTTLRSGGMLDDKFGVQLEANRVNGDSFREHSANNINNYHLRGVWKPTSDQALDLSLQQYDLDSDIAGALSTKDYKSNRLQSTRPWDTYSGKTRRYSAVYTKQFAHLNSLINSAEIGWQLLYQDSNRNFRVALNNSPGHLWDPAAPGTVLFDSPRSFTTWGVEPHLRFIIDKPQVKQTWLVGTRLQHEQLGYQLQQQSIATGVSALTRDWSIKNQAWTGYASNEIKLLDDALTLTPGIRVENLDQETRNITQNKTDSRYQRWLPALSASYQLTPAWYLYSDIQKSFHPPQFIPIVKGGNFNTETSWTYEGGVRYTPKPNVILNAGIYQIDYDNQVIYNNVLDSTINLGKTRTNGIELEAIWRPQAIDNLQLHAAYASLDAEQREGPWRGKQIPYSSRNLLLLDGNYRWHGTMLTLSGVYFSKSYSDAANTPTENAVGSTGPAPAYWLWNTRIGQVLYHSQQDTLTGYLEANNIFNRDYWFRGVITSPWGRLPAPGRSIVIGVTYTF